MAGGEHSAVFGIEPDANVPGSWLTRAGGGGNSPGHAIAFADGDAGHHGSGPPCSSGLFLRFWTGVDGAVAAKGHARKSQPCWRGARFRRSSSSFRWGDGAPAVRREICFLCVADADPCPDAGMYRAFYGLLDGPACFAKAALRFDCERRCRASGRRLCDLIRTLVGPRGRGGEHGLEFLCSIVG